MAMENAPMKNWELTMYELQRTPQEPITDGTEIAVSPRSLQSELKCPICLDILKMTMTTKECLHRFCSECIVTALRNGNKECPTCRKKLVSKRSLRCDPNFDALIAKIYPSREEYEAHQNKVLAKLNKQHMNAAISRSLENSSGNQYQHGVRGVFDGDGHFRNNRRQLDALRLATGGTTTTTNQADSVVSEDDAVSMTGSLNQRHSHVNSDTESCLDTNSVGGASSIGASESIRTTRVTSGTASCSTNAASAAVVPEIELLLKPYPPLAMKPDSSLSDRCADYAEQRTSVAGSASPRAYSDVPNSQDISTDLTPAVKYLKAPSITTVDHLSRYLSVRFNLQRLSKDITENDQHFALFFYNEPSGEYERLQPHLTIEEVSRSYWNKLHNLDLYYQRE